MAYMMVIINLIIMIFVMLMFFIIMMKLLGASAMPIPKSPEKVEIFFIVGENVQKTVKVYIIKG